MGGGSQSARPADRENGAREPRRTAAPVIRVPPSPPPRDCFGVSASVASAAGRYNRGDSRATNHATVLRMNIAIAVVLSGALIAAAVLFTFRWELAAFGGQAYRLDRWTGAIVACNVPSQNLVDAGNLGVGIKYRCSELTAAEAANSGIDPRLK